MPKRQHFFQQLFVSDRSVNIGEELAARVKDPLWFLARQWQSGEFEAENGGRAASLQFETRAMAFKTLHFPDAPSAAPVPVKRSVPLEALVEAEQEGASKAWRSQALEYAFDIETAGHRLKAREYYGNALDWYHFDLVEKPGTASARAETTRHQLIPTQMHFAGAPHPRWWRFEEGDGYFDAPAEVEPNVLTLLMPEFFYADINNWYVAPVDLPSGSVCEVGNVKITDTFGQVTTLNPVSDPNWKVFELAAADQTTTPQGLLMVPNVALDILHNDLVEDVRFVRDEAANMVWAVEHSYRDAAGNQVSNGDSASAPATADAGPPGTLEEFRLTTTTPAHWIPYVPRKPQTSGSPSGDMYLRRGRTLEEASAANPQYHGRIVGESIRVNEEEIPRTGLRIRRLERFARGSDGEEHFWTGRVRTSGRTTVTSGLRFDILVGPSGG